MVELRKILNEEFCDPNFYFGNNCFVQVISNEEMMGYIIFLLHQDSYHIYRLKVFDEFRRSGNGTKLVSYLKSRMRDKGRRRLTCQVPEKDLSSQLFLKKNGFFCYDLKDNNYFFEFWV